MEHELLLEKLKDYGKSDFYPFHMPGHKRQAKQMGQQFPDPFSIDITEIDGFDNLHHAESLLKESMDWMAKVYGADESFYLVNGSSCGLLSAIAGCTRHRGTILISRNCHKAVYHGIIQNELKTEYVYPQNCDALGIQGGILPEDVEEKLKSNPDIQAVLIVSPTYDGVVSDIGKIAELVHRYGLPLIVDEAHGAHFPFGKEGEFPVSAVKLGADVVIQSLHKTLPSLTQTAVLHMNHHHLREGQLERIRRSLSVYQTSSPSYVFLAAMEWAVDYMDRQGRERLSWLSGKLTEFRRQCENFKQIRIPSRAELSGNWGIYDYDESKLVLSMIGTGKDGLWLSDQLRKNYHLELEMSAVTYGLALTSLWDQEEGFERLCAALHEIDRQIDLENSKKWKWKEHETAILRPIRPKAVLGIYEAMEENWKSLEIENCEGKISSEFVYLYPPGIPVLVPGEQIENEMIQLLKQYQDCGFSIQGIHDYKGKRIRVVAE